MNARTPEASAARGACASEESADARFARGACVPEELANARASQTERAARAAWWLVFALAVFALWPERAHWPPAATAPPALGEGAARLLWGLELDLNRAPAHALTALPGIGPGRAAAIVAARPFCEVHELTRVRGIGPETLARVRAQLRVAPPPAHCARARN